MKNDEDDERFRNFISFKVYATDAELEGVSPYVIIILMIFLCVIPWCC